MISRAAAALGALLMVAALTPAAAFAADECNIERIGKLVVAHEGGKLAYIDRDNCTESSLILPHARDVSINELDGRIVLAFRYEAPPKVGGLEHLAMARIAALATGRTGANADWLVRQCLVKMAAIWGKSDDFELNIPGEKRLDQQSFSCGPEKFADKGKLRVRFGAAFEWPDPHR
jgi:hypothetical protein